MIDFFLEKYLNLLCGFRIKAKYPLAGWRSSTQKAMQYKPVPETWTF